METVELLSNGKESVWDDGVGGSLRFIDRPVLGGR